MSAGRRVTTAATMLVLCLILVLGAVWGWRSLFAPLPGFSDAPSASCTTKTVNVGGRIRTSQVRVSVFNGGTRSGLAARTRAALADRGFKIGIVGNAPSDARVRRVQVWSTQKDDAGARLVARQFGVDVGVRFSDGDLGPGVDVIIGNGFHGLARAPRSIKVRASQDVCVSGDGAANQNAG